MTIYSYKALASDLRKINDCYSSRNFREAQSLLEGLDKKIGSNYQKRDFFSDVGSLIASSDKRDRLSKICRKLKLIQSEKSIVFLAKKFYSGQFHSSPESLIHWEYNQRDSTSSVLNAHFASLFEQEIQKVVQIANELEGPSTLPPFVMGTLVGAIAFTNLLPAIATGVAAGALYKLCGTYQSLGDSTPRSSKPYQSPVVAQLRHRDRHI